MRSAQILFDTLKIAEGEIVTAPQWTSSAVNHRLNLREELQGHMNLLLDIEQRQRDPWQRQIASLVDLETVPQLRGFTISISHCPSLGGYAYARMGRSGEFQIGFDVEETERAEPHLVRRMTSSPDEISRAPNPAMLWVAKEATFKSLLGHSQPAVLSQIEIHNWQKLSPELCTFDAKSADSTSICVHGATLEKDRLTLGLAQFLPQLWSRTSR